MSWNYWKSYYFVVVVAVVADVVAADVAIVDHLVLAERSVVALYNGCYFRV